MPRLRARWVIAAVIAVHAIFFLSPPLALTDIFNYVNYGRMEVVHNLNPYTTIPILEPHNDPSYDLSNWHQLLSPYGPLFTLLTFVVVPLGVAASFWVLKGLLALASLATIALVWKCARLLGRDPVAAIVLVGLNPIVLVWGLGGDHNDFLMVLLIVLGFYLLLLARERRARRRRRGAAPRRRPAPQASGDRSTRQRGRADAGSGLRARVTHGDWRGTLRGWLLPLSPIELAAGAAFVTAAAIKASGGVLIPVVLAALAAHAATSHAGRSGNGRRGRGHGAGEPDRVRAARARSEHAEPPGDQRQRAQPDRAGTRQGRRDRIAARRAERSAARSGGAVLPAGLA